MKNTVGIVILNYNGANDTIECLESLKKNSMVNKVDIFVLDNGSEIDDIIKLEKYAQGNNFAISSISKLEDKTILDNNKHFFIKSALNYGFAGGNNIIIKKIQDLYKYILLLNNDTIVRHDFLQKMLNLFEQDSNVGFGSCRINNYYNQTLLWNCGGKLRPWGLRRYYTENDLHKMPSIINAEFITGCALFIRSSVIRKYGTLTNDFFHGEEDFNFCWRMKKNHIKGKCINETLVYHKVSATSQKSGGQPGKLASYYAYRIVDMKQFYPKIIWTVWMNILIQLLKIRWVRAGYSKEEIKKMSNIIKHASKLNTINREDTLKMWDLTY